jgi:single-strand DNA-binding protein
MANLNRVMLIGRLTRDPEIKAFPNGGKVVKIGFAVNNRKKNQQTGQYEDEPVFLNIEAFNRGEHGKLADLCEQYLRKGSSAYFEGHLKLDQWTSQDGQKRSELRVVAESVQFLDPKGGGGRDRSEPRSTVSDPDDPPPMRANLEEPIPF